MSTLGKIRPELDVLVHCLRPTMSQGTRTELSRLWNESIDWAYLLDCARKHAVVPTLHFHLSTAEREHVPKDFLAALQQDYVHGLGRRECMMVESAKLDEQFQAAGVEVVYFKGLLLGARYYGDINLRDCDDIDILVNRDDAISSQKILLRNSYNYGHEELSFSTISDFLQTPYALKFLSQIPFHGPITVDLHWDVFDNGLARLPAKLLFANAERVDGKHLTLPSEVLLSLVCVHGVKSYWFRLKWIVDVAEILESEGFDWNKALAFAKTARCYNMVLFGCALASHLPDVNLPPAVKSEIERRKDMLVTVEKIFDRILFRPQAEDWKLLEKWRFYLSLQDSTWNRVVLTLRLLTDPRIDDWLRHKLPEWAFPLYRVLHLGHVARVSALPMVQRLKRRVVK